MKLNILHLVSIAAAQITSCEFRGPQEWCSLANGTTFPLSCHVTGSQTWCSNPGGSDFLRGQSAFALNGTTSATTTSGTNSTATGSEEEEEEEANCHFHAGVEHCVGGAKSSRSCAGTKRDYNIPLRIGALFVVLVTSAIACLSPILLTRFTQLSTSGIVFIMIKNFGAGVVISTALIHLMTHATLLFASECLGHLQYEGVVAAFIMAGIFLSFLVEYAGWRLVARRADNAQLSETSSTSSVKEASGKQAAKIDEGEIGVVSDKTHAPGAATRGQRKFDLISVLVMEAGILFHSVFIGITCIVTPDSGFGQIFAVIIFHQMFEGLALAARIADSSTTFRTKMLLCLGFTLITPMGMGIGIGMQISWSME